VRVLTPKAQRTALTADGAQWTSPASTTQIRLIAIDLDYEPNSIRMASPGLARSSRDTQYSGRVKSQGLARIPKQTQFDAGDFQKIIQPIYIRSLMVTACL
jgi:hypothetical protein